MAKKMAIDLTDLLNSLNRYQHISLENRVPVALCHILPSKAVLFDPQETQGKWCWAIVYPDGSDSFVYLDQNKVYTEGEHQEENFQNIHQFVNDLNTQPVFSVEDSLAWEIY